MIASLLLREEKIWLGLREVIEQARDHSAAVITSSE